MTVRESSPGKNWAGNYEYRAKKTHRPATIEELQEIVVRTTRVRVLGSRHSFNDIADSLESVTLEDMPAEVAVDPTAGKITCNAAIKYGELAERLNAEGLALPNLASPYLRCGRRGDGDARFG